ncbi:hypothetical protein L1049_018086 [Liquidambar formosana]|uniref:Uncharacterized protein n=1 Tax=Liquidambar formosana TaxID=63359 RepID=A0AAP0NN43_LIQFO
MARTLRAHRQDDGTSDILDWRKVHKQDIDKTEFEFANPLTRGWLRVKFGELWRGAKYWMNRDFHDNELPLQLQYKDLPDHLDDNQWKNLVYHWREPKTKEWRARTAQLICVSTNSSRYYEERKAYEDDQL